ncbi:MAG: heparinase II/III family protein, partial [Candidatus Latescibacteria bacterium]|nr:heparinase II/III family protein [Candidatus Latescibacterota bacterium]
MDDMVIQVCTVLGVTVSILFCLSVVSVAAVEIPHVPKGHPRVYVQLEDLPDVRNKIEMPEFQEAWEQIRTSDQPVCKAFVYLVTGDEVIGRQAIVEGLENLESGHDGRPFYNHMHKAACIYDWCYDLLSDQDKADYIAAFKTFAALDHNRGYPPNPERAKSVTGHDCEGFVMTNMMPSGVAIYGEDPEMYEASAQIFFDQHLPACNYYYQAHMHHQGTHYNGERFVHDIATAWMFRKMGAGDIFSADQQFVLYQLIYHLRPDDQFLKMGDDNDGTGNSLHKRLPARLAGMYYDDSYLLAFSECKSFSGSQHDFYSIFDLLFLKPNAPRAEFDELPLTKYFDFPMGTMVVRTGWDRGVESKSAMVQMHIGQMYYSNHHHLDFGTFQIYYRGLLAMDTGVYQAGDESMYGTDPWRDYYQQTLAHNGLMIFDPATLKEDHGGQHAIRHETRTLEDLQKEHRRLGRVTGWAFGPDEKTPRYSYLAGDVTQAYGTKAEKVARSMVMLNTGDEMYPCVFVVYDQVVSKQADFKKAWYLHSLQEPVVNGMQTTVVCDGEAYYGGQYGGQLVVETLLPSEVTIEKVGGSGKECWNEATQKNYVVDLSGSRAKGDELGAWRIEVIPT